MIFSGYAEAQSRIDSTYFHTETILANIDCPWEIVWGPDGHIWMTHRTGMVSRVNVNTGSLNTILEIKDQSFAGSRQMSMAVHPQFEEHPFVYISYNYHGPNYNSPLNHSLYMKIVRFEYDATSDVLVDPVIIIDGIPIFDGYHDGGKLLISDNHIYLTIGDAKQPENPELHPYMTSIDLPLPQNRNVFTGKILRMNMDGSVPHDNPFAVAPYEKIPRNFIWTIGHRNTQGLANGKDGKLYYAEHGRNNDDECGIVVKGKNYGWPLIEGYCDKAYEAISCDTIKDHQVPLVSWNPNVAPSNMEYVSTSSIGELTNSIVVATLTGDGFGRHIEVLSLNDAGDEVVFQRSLVDKQFGRIRDFCVSPEGDLYFSTSNRSLSGSAGGLHDQIIKIVFDSVSTVNEVTSVSESLTSQFVVWPNPASREITVSLPPQQGSLEMIDSKGNCTRHETYGRESLKVKTAGLPEGVYVFRWSNMNVSIMRRVFILGSNR